MDVNMATEEKAIVESPTKVPPTALKDKIQELWEKFKSLEEVAQEQDSLNWAFDSIPVAVLPPVPHGQIIEIRSDASVAEAVATLHAHNILSAPVVNVDAPEDASWLDAYMGMVDFYGIVAWVLHQANFIAAGFRAGATSVGAVAGGVAGVAGAALLGATGVGAPLGVGLAGAVFGGAAAAGAMALGPGRSGPAAANSLGDDFFKLLQESELYHRTKVGDIAGSFRWAPFLPVQPEDSLLCVMLLASKYRLRSVPVVESGEKKVSNLITQSSVIRALAECQGTPWFDRVAGRQLFLLGLPVKPPEKLVKVEEDQPVLSAFSLLVEHNIGGVPVVRTGTSQMVANISARDMGVLLTNPGLLRQQSSVTVRAFIEQAQPPHGTTDSISPLMTPPVTCGVDATLLDVISIISRAHIHRVYVESMEGNVVGVITLRDIIGKFVTEPEGYFGRFFEGVAPAPASA